MKAIRLRNLVRRYCKTYGYYWFYKPPIIIWPRRTIVRFLNDLLDLDHQETYSQTRHSNYLKQYEQKQYRHNW